MQACQLQHAKDLQIDHPNENFGSFPNTKEEIQNETNQRKK